MKRLDFIKTLIGFAVASTMDIRNSEVGSDFDVDKKVLTLIDRTEYPYTRDEVYEYVGFREIPSILNL